MKVVKNSMKEFNGSLISVYDFDRINQVQDWFEIFKIFIESGIQIKSIKVSEFGDYDDDKQIIVYKNLANIGQMVTDFNNKAIETISIDGSVSNYKINATIYTDNNRMRICYLPQIQRQIEIITNKFSR